MLFVHSFFFSGSSPCGEGAEIAFILDSSGSLGRRGYKIQKTFVKEIMYKLGDKCTQLNAAVVLFSNRASVQLDFSKKFNLELFNSVIDRLFYTQGLTRIDKALLLTASSVFTALAGSQPRVPKISILVTDGKNSPSADNVPLSNVSEPLRQKGVRIFAVGIGEGVDLQELLEITGRKEDVFLVNSFSSLLGEVDRLVTNIWCAIGKYRISFFFNFTFP